MKEHLSGSIASNVALGAPLQEKGKSIIPAARHAFGGVFCAGAVLLIVSSVQAQNLFVTGWSSGSVYEYTPGGSRSTFASGISNPAGLAFDRAGNLFVASRDEVGSSAIYEFTPGGVQSTFATGLNNPNGLAFNSAGMLFESDYGSGNIYEYTPGGVRSTFATGLVNPYGMAFNGAGNLFVGDQGSGCIYEYTPGGEQSTFASGLGYDVWDLTFQGDTLPVPEPSALGLLAFGLFGITLLRRRQR